MFQPVLRPSEVLKVKLQGIIVPLEERNNRELQLSTEQANAFLVIAVHRNPNRNEEEGCLFVYEGPALPTPARLRTPRIRNVFPIVGHIDVRISQINNEPSLDMDERTEGSQPNVRLSIEIYNDNTTVLAFVSDEPQGIPSFLSEFRRLKGIAHKNNPHASKYPWLTPYSYDPSCWLSVMPPPDLRVLRQPLNERLSIGSAGMPGNEVADYNAIRDHWFRNKARHNATKPELRPSELKIRIGTFNVNGKLPSQDLSPWVGGQATPQVENDKTDEAEGSLGGWEKLIPPMKEVSPISLGDFGRSVSFLDTHPTDVTAPATDGSTSVEHDRKEDSPATTDPDLLVFGFQELDNSTAALVIATKAREALWTHSLVAALGENGEKYEKLVSQQLVGMLIIVFVKKELRQFFSGGKTDYVSAGIGGVLGNKGAAAVRITYCPPPCDDGTTPLPSAFTFVNSHLAAFETGLERRDADFHDISRRLSFKIDQQYTQQRSESKDYEPAEAILRVYESDALFWMVDLNYRLNLPEDDVRTILRSAARDKSAYSLLLYHDQLRESIRKRRAFAGFLEQPIQFLPTYRFGAGLLTDSLGYDIKRKPAWTDRILHLPSPSISVRQLSYSGHPRIAMSDHRPVSADFSVQIPVIDTDGLDRTAHTLYKAVSKANPEELDDIPTLRLTTTALDLGVVSYEKAVCRSITVQNTSEIPAAFRFYANMPGESTHPSWLNIEPMTGFLLPGEQCDLSFTVLVSRINAQDLNVRRETLDSTLILHTLLGKDHFISLSGQYASTCFGNSLSVLARLPGPVRNLKGPGDLLPENEPIHGSREIQKLVAWLNVHEAERFDDLFLTEPDSDLIADIRERLDTGADLGGLKARDESPDQAAYAHAVAHTLIALLDSLPEPIVPFSLHTRCAAVNDREEALELQMQMPALVSNATVNAWSAIIGFLHVHCSVGAPPALESDWPRQSRAERLAPTFTRVLLRDEPEQSELVSPVGKRRFLSYFLVA
ncbi:DNase I-like protein [Stereum hirsutum FP-91666 SS1]|uniref:DNase I-like protein n=1 Tax=Stereum hirsutum (strain FP-91666) TaxID=721885 RepID=UPI000440AEE3|nr:DNase I-like protein [Stereum hirsutum FP-91666 SS1]EIM92905.1 DNase I-like protein [Stereum hirsutum FP-91666 SS1]